MTYQYMPGVLSHLYQGMPSSERAEVDSEVDRLFRQETRVTAKLDWNNVKDRPQARYWLTIRDVAVAKRYLRKVGRLRSQLHLSQELNISALAQSHQNNLPNELRQRGMLPPHADPLWGKFLEVTHLAIEAFHYGELADLWPAVVGAEAAEVAGVVSLIIGPFVAILGGLYAIGHANEAGQRAAERNAFKWGFADTIAAMAEGKDWHPSLSQITTWGHQQARGRNGAIQMVKGMGRDVGLKFLRRYEGHNGKETILADMGGYEL